MLKRKTIVGMTGFAQAQGYFRDTQFNLEVRSVNHRFLECLVYCPEGFQGLEDVIKGAVRNKINRGRITVSLSVVSRKPQILVDYGLAESYVKALKQLNERLKLENSISLGQVIKLDGVLKIKKIEVSGEFIQAVKLAAARALDRLTMIRQKEGNALAIDIARHINSIKKEADRISLLAKNLSKEKKKVLCEEEYTVFLRNTDISEEMTRINYHLKSFLETIKKPAPCGKELDFIAQEIQREANTLSSKSQSGEISGSAVKIKSAIDKIREQAQNIE